MTPPEHGPDRPDHQQLREEAQNRLRRRRPGDLAALPSEDLQVLIHELEVHQAELEVQNEELRRTQARLAEARDAYEDLYEHAPVGYLTLDAKGAIRRTNLAASRICGVDRKILIGQRMEKLLAAEDRDACYLLLRETAAHGGVHEREFRLACPDGRQPWVGATASPLEDGNGQAAGFRVTLSDITDRKRAEETLHAAVADAEGGRRQLEAVMEALPVGIAIVDAQGGVVRANRMYEQMWGPRPATRSVRDYAAYRARWLDSGQPVQPGEWASAQAVEFGRFVGGQILEIERFDGGRVQVHNSAAPIHDATGRVVGAAVAVADISERAGMELALRESQRQLKDLAATLEERVIERTSQLQALAAQLAQAEQRERHQLAKVLHDHLQQLLVGASFHLGILRRQTTEAKVLDSVERVKELIDESVQASRSLTAELSPPILYEGTMRQALEWLSRWMREKHGLNVDLEVQEETNVQREEFRVLAFGIVRELLLNVVKHAKVREASVHMSRVNGQTVRVVVADKGVGFDPARVGPREDGGFGLFGMRQRLTALGGEIRIDAASGDGTRVTVVMPADIPATVREAAQQAAASPSPAADAAGANRAQPPRSGEPKIRVLLADDHAVVRDGLSRLLLVQRGIDVVGAASNGQEALEMALQLSPDVVVMDVSMPDLNGMEATRRILSRRPRTRVIGLSMHTDPDIATAMKEAGAAAYLAKTLPPETLVRTIREQAGQPIA